MNEDSYAQYLKNSKQKPKTPILQQLNTDLGNEDKSNITGTNNSVTSPQSANTPQYGNIQLFPTPMTYLPSSPMQGLGLTGVISPTSQGKNIPTSSSEIYIKKRRDKLSPLKNFDSNEINNINHQHKDSRNLDEILKSEHRIVSELVPAPTITSKRISSLPTVGEELQPSLESSSGLTIYENIQDGTKYEDFKSINDRNIDLLNVYLVPSFDAIIKVNKLRQIGSGNFSRVDLYQTVDLRNSSSGTTKWKFIAIKKIIYPDNLIIPGRHIFNNELLSSFESSLTRELSVLQKLNHPCVIHLYGINNPIFLTNKTPLTTLLKQTGKITNNMKVTDIIPECDIAMSYCPGGDLLNALTDCNGGLEMSLVQRIFVELTSAVKYLHDHLIIHRDLKLENILLQYPLDEIKSMSHDESKKQFYLNNNIIQLTDFGLCKEIANYEELCTARCGSEDYVSPEILMGIPYDGRLSDSWAMGVILYALLEDRLPFDPPVNASIRQRRRATSHRIAGFEWNWYKLKDINMSGKEIVTNTLARKNKRWDVSQIIESSFVSEVIKDLTFI